MRNIGKADKIIRLLVAIVITVLFLNHVISGVLGMVLVILAAVFVLTSLIGTCPLYLLFKINTNNKK